jgi:hypothetical protein
MPQWLLGVSTGEAAAIYCFYSIPTTISFMPYFKNFFTVQKYASNQNIPLKN